MMGVKAQVLTEINKPVMRNETLRVEMPNDNDGWSKWSLWPFSLCP